MKQYLGPLIRTLVIVTVTIVVIYGLGISTRQTDAQSPLEQTFAERLQATKDSEIPMYIRFIEPINGQSVGWDVPANIISDGEIVGQRYIEEIGKDYMCIVEAGQGLIQTYCIPFSNIAHIVYPAL